MQKFSSVLPILFNVLRHHILAENNFIYQNQDLSVKNKMLCWILIK